MSEAKASSGRGLALTRTRAASAKSTGWGGARAGSGRKAVLDGGRVRAFVMTDEHVALIDAWQRSHNLESRSAALRHMIETAKLREV